MVVSFWKKKDVHEDHRDSEELLNHKEQKRQDAHTHTGEPHQGVFDFYFQASMWACVMNDVESRLEEKKQLELRVECADAGLRENKRQINTVLNDPARDIRFSLYSGSCQNEGMNEGSHLPNTPPTHPKKAKIKRSFLCV